MFHDFTLASNQWVAKNLFTLQPINNNLKNKLMFFCLSLNNNYYLAKSTDVFLPANYQNNVCCVDEENSTFNYSLILNWVDVLFYYYQS